MRQALAAAIVVLAASVVQGEQMLIGKIADSACGAKHESGGEMGDEMNDRDCTLACVRGGSKFVIVADGKIYKIANQDRSELRRNAGERVRVTGDIAGDTIVITKVEVAK